MNNDSRWNVFRKNHLLQSYEVHCSEYDADRPECLNCPSSSIDATAVMLLQECQAFYYVFQNLECRLGNSGIVSKEQYQDQPIMLSIPYFVNGAFAAELALKLILHFHQIPYALSEGHKLDCLFNLLPKGDRDALVERLQAMTEISETDLQKALESISEVFVQQRYVYEHIGENHACSRFLKSFVHVVCDYVLCGVRDKVCCIDEAESAL